MHFLSPSSTKTFWRGTHRTRPPTETVNLARTVASRAGITRVADITGLDRIGIPVVSVIRPNARSVSVSQGKGLDLDSAKASGLMEAIEGYHAESVSLPLRHETLHDMLSASAPIADISRLARVGEGQFDPYRKLFWVEGKTLLDEQPVWLPYETVHTDFTDDTLVRVPSFFMSSNGLASGNHRAEAWNHALYEVIERDSATLWELSRTKPGNDTSHVDLNTISHGDCQQVLAQYVRAGIRVVVRDITSDVGVPCFRCTIGEEAGMSMHPRAPTSGYGCHADRSIALLRALLEAAQSRLTIIAGAREDIPHRAYDPRAIHDANAAFLEQSRNLGQKSFEDVPDHAGDTFVGDLHWLSERLAAVGCTQIIGIDLTKPEFDVPVVRIVVPGLEAMCSVPDYVPGSRARNALIARSAAGS